MVVHVDTCVEMASFSLSRPQGAYFPAFDVPLSLASKIGLCSCEGNIHFQAFPPPLHPYLSLFLSPFFLCCACTTVHNQCAEKMYVHFFLSGHAPHHPLFRGRGDSVCLLCHGSWGVTTSSQQIIKRGNIDFLCLWCSFSVSSRQKSRRCSTRASLPLFLS